MHRANSDESLSYQSRADDRFFVIATVLLPFCAQGAYLFDVFYYHTHSELTGYECLLSTTLSVFVYLQYSVPLRSRYLRFFYHFLLWILSEIGSLGHVVYYSKKNDVFHLVLYSLAATIDSIYFAGIVYCRVFAEHNVLRVHMPKIILRFISMRNKTSNFIIYFIDFRRFIMKYFDFL
jgi:hypothetical protein